MNSNAKAAAITRLVDAKTGYCITVDRRLKSKLTANEILKDAGLPKAF